MELGAIFHFQSALYSVSVLASFITVVTPQSVYLNCTTGLFAVTRRQAQGTYEQQHDEEHFYFSALFSNPAPSRRFPRTHDHPAVVSTGTYVLVPSWLLGRLHLFWRRQRDVPNPSIHELQEPHGTYAESNRPHVEHSSKITRRRLEQIHAVACTRYLHSFGFLWHCVWLFTRR